MRPITSAIDEDDRGEEDDQSVGDGATGEQDRTKDLVVHDVEDVVELARSLVDEVGVVVSVRRSRQQPTGGGSSTLRSSTVR